jgi:hypothetical protein
MHIMRETETEPQKETLNSWGASHSCPGPLSSLRLVHIRTTEPDVLFVISGLHYAPLFTDLCKDFQGELEAPMPLYRLGQKRFL